jgi:hypothetical protein
MTNAIQTHRERALDSPYSRDRREAITQLERLFPDAAADEQRRILETLREIVHQATSTQERELARDTMAEAFDSDPSVAASVVVPCFCDLAESASHSDERLDAIDSLREFYPAVDEQLRTRIETKLTEIAESATYEDERRRAQRRLSDVISHDGQSETGDGDGAVGYLAQSLAEQLADAADESAVACVDRTEELREFVDNNPVDDDEYETVRDELVELAEQLAVVPTDGEFDDERKRRIRKVANRVERLYLRSE